jgi:hypothetical protein
LTYWRHLLLGTKEPVKVFVDHTNLLHYWHPQKVNWRIARYILTLADYHILLQHRPGLQNWADALSKRLDYDQGEEDNQEVTPLPPYLFRDHIWLVALDVTAVPGGTLEWFTWFRCTWWDSRKVRLYALMLGSGTDRSDSLASLSQAYTSWYAWIE